MVSINIWSPVCWCWYSGMYYYTHTHTHLWLALSLLCITGCKACLTHTCLASQDVKLAWYAPWLKVTMSCTPLSSQCKNGHSYAWSFLNWSVLHESNLHVSPEPCLVPCKVWQAQIASQILQFVSDQLQCHPVRGFWNHCCTLCVHLSLHWVATTIMSWKGLPAERAASVGTAYCPWRWVSSIRSSMAFIQSSISHNTGKHSVHDMFCLW